MTGTYDERFFADRGGSHRSAQVVVPLLIDLLAPRSVVDLGCGTGEWLSVFREHGVDDVLGVDGDYVDRSRLAIPEELFRPHDLTSPVDLGRRFELAISLEVGEHLPEASAAGLAGSLAAAAPLVLFGAAIPDQRGEGHVNEQWQDWWAGLFAAHGYVAVDAIRRPLWQDDRVSWWYTQNTLLYAAPDELERRPLVRQLHERTAQEQLAVVHPSGYLSFRSSGRLRERLRRRRG